MEENRTGSRFGNEIYDWVQCIVAAIVISILLFSFGARVVGVDGSSMVPTLYNRDKLIVSSVMYTPKQGDVVILQTDTFDGNLLVKRVVATGGQTVDIDFDAGIVYVDGEPLQEDYTAELTYVREDFSGEVQVPEGYVFVMGDNRNHSSDSRSDRVGVVDARRLIGKAYLLIPMGQQTDVYGSVVGGRDWSRFGKV